MTASRLLSIILPFVAGLSVVFAIGAAAYFLRGDDDDENGNGVARTPTPTVEGTPTVPAGPYPVLADGDYIDSLPAVRTRPIGFGANPLTQAASVATAIAVIEVTAIVDTIIPTPVHLTPTPSVGDQRPSPWTISEATVLQWIKGGNGAEEITVSILGGIDVDGPRLYTGTFLPQVGRTYIVTLDPPDPDIPGNTEYVAALTGWANFEVGDGTIRVLNEDNSGRLMGAYNLTPLDDFIALIREWIVAPPAVTPTPPPSPTVSP